MRKPTTLLLVLAAGLSCSKDSGTGPKPTPPPVITVMPDSATVDLFDTLRLQATVRDSQGNLRSDPVTWSSDDANTVFVSTGGRVQALKRGTITITASAGGGQGQARIKVRINVIQVQLHPTAGTLQVGDTQRIKDTLITANGQLPDDSSVAWSSSDTTKAVVSSSGLVTARAQGSVNIFAKVDSARASAGFTIPEPVTEIILSAHLDTLREDSTFNVTATAIGVSNDTLLRPVTWTSSDTSIAKFSGDGFGITIGAYEPGRAVIRAQIGPAFDSCVVIVVRPSIASMAISVIPNSGVRVLPGAFAAHATIKDSTGVVLTRRLITWTLSDTSVADIGPDTGTDVTVTGKKSGVERVSASSEGKTDSADLNFVHPSVAGEHIVPDTGSFIIPTQPSFSLYVYVLDSASDTLTDRVTTWAINDTSIATLSALTGPGTSIIGRKAGLAVVVATTETHTDTAKILVIRPTVKHVVITPDTSSIVVPGTTTVGAVVEDSLGQQLLGRSIHWVSADTAIATVSDTSGDGVTVTGKVAGTARIVASSEGVTDTGIVHVIRPSVAKVDFEAPVDTSPLLLGTTRIVTAAAKDSTNAVLTDRVITFTSSDSAVVSPEFRLAATDYAQERLGALSIGSATVAASAEGKSVTWHASTYSVTYDTIAAANDGSCALVAGTPYCWRYNGYPHAITNAGTLGSITADGDHACGLDASGGAHCWGDNYYGQLGSNGPINFDSAETVLGGLQFLQIDAGANHTCGVSVAHDAWCWGDDGWGQIGTDDSLDALFTQPTLVAGGLAFAVVSAGRDHTCGLIATGAAYCWGLNTAGQLGATSGSISRHPIAVSGGLTFVAITAGASHSCGLTAAGAAYCWGSNESGNLGVGDVNPRSTPTLVPGGLTFISISAGYDFTCGVASGGSAYCWGANFNYQLGTGAQSAYIASPTLVAGGLTFKSVTLSAGGNDACGMTSTGAAYCWGYGAIGNPDGVASSPTKVPGQP